LLNTVLAQPLARWNYPQWWIDAAQTAYPQQWQEILQAGNRQPPLTLRVNLRKTSVEAICRPWPRPASKASRSAPPRCAWPRP
jgi:16S rRNA (cytosine967-C5)-methyltransferase